MTPIEQIVRNYLAINDPVKLELWFKEFTTLVRSGGTIEVTPNPDGSRTIHASSRR